MFRFRVNGQRITRLDDEKPVAKCRHLYRAHFDFIGDEWQGTKTAIFVQGNYSKAQMLDEFNECEIPWEFFDTDTFAYGYVSVFCGDLVTVDKACVEIDASGYENADHTATPTPNAYQQIINRMDKEANELPQKIKSEIDAYDKAHQIEAMATIDEIKAYMEVV